MPRIFLKLHTILTLKCIVVASRPASVNSVPPYPITHDLQCVQESLGHEGMDKGCPDLKEKDKKQQLSLLPIPTPIV